MRDADRKKDEFLATLGHELRNPLAPIRNAVHYLGMEGLKEPDVRTARDVIARQVAVYAGAERLIFAEGSALHGRQLLGHLPQDIEVLRRRPDKVMARAQLRPRCRNLTYHDITASQLMAYWKSGAPRPDPALSLYDIPALWHVFQGFGVDLARYWDAGAFVQAARADAADWSARQNPKPHHRAEHRAVLARAGLASCTSGQ